MRKITGVQIFLFLAICTLIFYFALYLSNSISRLIPLENYEPIFMIASFLTFTFALAIAFYRICLLIFPLPTGEIAIKSREEFAYHIHLLFYLLFFHPIMRSEILPLPFMKVVYLGLGAKMGANTFSSGLILDPIFVDLGDNTLIGQGAIIVPHAIENEKLGHYPIKIGSNVTIGTGARILPGVTVEDHALVSANAVLIKGTHVKKGEIWGGVPARKIGQRYDNEPTTNHLQV